MNDPILQRVLAGERHVTKNGRTVVARGVEVVILDETEALFDKMTYDDAGFDSAGYRRNGYDRDGYDRDGFDNTGYRRDGYHRDGNHMPKYHRSAYHKLRRFYAEQTKASTTVTNQEAS